MTRGADPWSPFTPRPLQCAMAGALRRSLNLPQLVFYGIGTIVGAGIYSVIGAAAELAGRRRARC